jgi:hypothetical protein
LKMPSKYLIVLDEVFMKMTRGIDRRMNTRFGETANSTLVIYLCDHKQKERPKTLIFMLLIRLRLLCTRHLNYARRINDHRS